MPDLASLQGARLEVPFGDATIVVLYRPSLVTKVTQDALRGLQARSEYDPFFAELSRILIAWDLTSDGAPIPLTAEGFAGVGVSVIGSVMNAIVLDVGNPTWEAVETAGPIPSSNGSSKTDAWAPSPTTTISSSPPSGPASTPPTWPDSPTPVPPSAGTPGSATSGAP